MLGGLWFAIACAFIAIVYGVLQSRWIISLPAGNVRMQEIAAAVREGASAYLKRQYTTISVVGVSLKKKIGLIPKLGWATAWGFAIGGLVSGLSGIIGMEHSVTCELRAPEARRHGRGPVRDLCGDDHRHHDLERAGGEDGEPGGGDLSARDRRLRHHRLDHRHLVREDEAGRQERHAGSLPRPDLGRGPRTDCFLSDHAADDGRHSRSCRSR